MSSRTWLRRAAVTALAASVPLATVPAASAAPSATPQRLVVAVPADTASPTPSSTTERPVTKGEQGDLSFGYLLFGVILALGLALGAWFLRTRRGRPQ
ncbi:MULTISPECIES: hypothetical protein [Arsenicicoccus]|uniref:LPXTG cell wall anchor domain-containing protein n=1 Tax=Arsenicicoccus bolidensis TaxID=229480 RepID=A0ABS9PXK8_9MICO|nr:MULTISPECIES: hypothetical protein [Arsenicicoccus]MCG7320356.1 hypothetical protein [Arsenicicoccus bolidensis]